MISPRPCTYCGGESHASLMCQKKPRKPLNKMGRITRRWVITRNRWINQNKAVHYFCYICNVMMTEAELTLDHIKSRSRHPELRFELSNLAPCCAPCNAEKGSRSLEEYLHARSGTIQGQSGL